jgi:hypothetical protein
MQQVHQNVMTLKVDLFSNTKEKIGKQGQEMSWNSKRQPKSHLETSLYGSFEFRHFDRYQRNKHKHGLFI